MNAPPPLPPVKRTSYTWVIVLAIVLLMVVGLCYGLYRAVNGITAGGVSGFTSKMDQQFGDQHLKTAVALLELHKLRTGRYPEDLKKLQFTGQWDLLALQSVRYVAAADGKTYFVEVQRGWIGKPRIELPPEFWQGTGYNPALANAK
jgi:hypothetical protein